MLWTATPFCDRFSAAHQRPSVLTRVAESATTPIIRTANVPSSTPFAVFI